MYDQSVMETFNSLPRVGCFLGAIAAAVGSSIVGGLINRQSQKAQNTAQSVEADKERDWQEELANTAIQRRVKDLKEAGLNPILAAREGAAVGHAGIAQQVAEDGLGQSANTAFQSSLQTKQARSLIDLQKSQQTVNSATALKADMDTKKSAMETLEAGARTEKLNEETSKLAKENQREAMSTPYTSNNINSKILGAIREASKALQGK